jgi:hypothetical protein
MKDTSDGRRTGATVSKRAGGRVHLQFFFWDGLAPDSIYEHFPCVILAFSDEACKVIRPASAGHARGAKGQSDPIGIATAKRTPYLRDYPFPSLL